jgi:hypothetical protein
MRSYICNICGLEKDETEFYKDNRKESRKGVKASCKYCTRKLKSDRRKTYEGLIQDCWQSIRKCSKKRNHPMPDFTRAEFKEWIINNGYSVLYEEYKESGFNPELKPSIDRISDYEPYTFDNMNLTTWGINRGKYKPLISNNRRDITYFENNAVYRSSFKKVCERRNIDFNDFDEILAYKDKRYNRLYYYKYKGGN